MPAQLPPFASNINVGGAIAQGQALRRNQLAQQVAEQQMQSQNRLRELLPAASTGDANAMRDLAGVNPQAALQVSQFNQQLQQQQHIEEQRGLKRTYHLINSIKDQDSFDTALDIAERLGMDPQQIDNLRKEGYSPELINVLRARIEGAAGLSKPIGVPQKVQVGEKIILQQPTYDPSTGTYGMATLPTQGSVLAETPQQKVQTFTQKEQVKTEETRKREEQKNLITMRTKISSEIAHNARVGARQIPKIRDVLNGLKNVKTGKYAEAKRIFGPYIPGVDPTNEQALVTSLNLLVFDELAKFKGSISNQEREFAKETVAQLGNTPEANRIILEHMIQTAQRAVDEGKQFQAFKKSGGKPENYTYFEDGDVVDFMSKQIPQPESENERMKKWGAYGLEF